MLFNFDVTILTLPFKQDIYPNLSDGTSDPRNEGSFGHVVIAYDYDEEKDILYGNMGWSSRYYSHYNLDEYFNIQMSDYWTLNISSKLGDPTLLI